MSILDNNYKHTPGHISEATGHCLKCMKYVGLNPLGSLKHHFDNNGDVCSGSKGIKAPSVPTAEEWSEVLYSDGEGYCNVCHRHVGTQPSGELNWHGNENGVLCASVTKDQRPIGNYNAEIEWETGGYGYAELGPVGHIEENQTKGNTGAVKHCEGCGRFIPVNAKTGKMHKHTLSQDNSAICSQASQASDDTGPTVEAVTTAEPVATAEAMMKMRKCPFCGRVVQLDDLGRFMLHSSGKTSATVCGGVGKTYKQKEPINKTRRRLFKCAHCGHMVEVNNRGQFVIHNMNGKQDHSTEELCARSGAYVAPPITPPHGAAPRGADFTDFKKQRMFGKCDSCGKPCGITLDGTIVRHMRKMILSDGTHATEECPGKKAVANTTIKGSLQDTTPWTEINTQINEKIAASRASMMVVAPHTKLKVTNKQPYEPIDLDEEEEPEDYPNDGAIRNNKDGFISIW